MTNGTEHGKLAAVAFAEMAGYDALAGHPTPGLWIAPCSGAGLRKCAQIQ